MPCPLGYVIEHKTNNKPSIKEFTEGQTNFLAKVEHDRWMKEKIDDGWVYAPVRDNRKKHHNCLVPWEELSPAEQTKDIDAVNKIIPELDSIGYGVYKTK